MIKKRLRWGRLILCGSVLFLILVCILGSIFQDQLRSRLFPLLYYEEVTAGALEYELEPALIFAIIRCESGFNVNAKSKAGAWGLMQMLPSTALWINEKANFDYLVDDLWTPEHNIRLGCWYLNWLRNYYDGNLIAALAAYNAGLSHVNQWLTANVWDGTEEGYHHIPFAETRRYVSEVLRAKDIYTEILADTNAGSSFRFLL